MENGKESQPQAWRQSAIVNFARHFNQTIGDRRLEIDGEDEVGAVMAHLLDNGFENTSQPYLLDVALEYLEGSSRKQILTAHPEIPEQTRAVDAIKYAAERASEVVRPLMDERSRPETKNDSTEVMVDLKKLVERIAQTEQMDGPVAVGLLLLTDQVDGSSLGQQQLDYYSNYATSDIRKRCGSRTSTAGFVMLAQITGSTRDGLAPKSFKQLVEEVLDNPDTKLGTAGELLSDDVRRQRAKRLVSSRVAKEVAGLYGYKAMPLR